MLVFEIDRTQSDIVIERDIHAAARYIGQKRTMRLIEWQSNPAHTYQKLGIELYIVRPENQDAGPPDVVGFCDVFRSVEAQETCFSFESHAPLRMHIRVDQTSTEVALAVHRLKARHARPHGDVGPRSHG